MRLTGDVSEQLISRVDDDRLVKENKYSAVERGCYVAQ